jgi:hypothetical protein
MYFPLPGDNASDWERLLLRKQGVVSRSQIVRFATDKVVPRLATGRWQRPHRGVYVTHNGPLTAHQQLWVASLAVGGGRPHRWAACPALRVLGRRRFNSRAIHVLLPSARREANWM